MSIIKKHGPPVDIIHIILASRAVKLMALGPVGAWALRAIRRYVLLGLAPSGTYLHIARAGACDIHNRPQGCGDMFIYLLPDKIK
jgi:hypothetical protein